MGWKWTNGQPHHVACPSSPSCLRRSFAWSNAAMLAASRCDSTWIKNVEKFCFVITACCLLVVELCRAQTCQCRDIITYHENMRYHEILDCLWMSFSSFLTSNCSAASLDRACRWPNKGAPRPSWASTKIEPEYRITTTYTQWHNSTWQHIHTTSQLTCFQSVKHTWGWIRLKLASMPSAFSGPN